MPVYFNNTKLEGYENINNISKKIKIYSIENISQNNSKINIERENKIEFLNENGDLIFSTIISPHLENLENLAKSLRNGEYTFNLDPYEQLIPLKYSIIKINNEIFLNSVEHCKFT